MKSNVCVIENGTKDLSAILKESEKVAVYNELDRKQTMHLRLICEELDGMLPSLIGDFSGKFWIEFENGVCTVKVSIGISDLSGDRRRDLIALAKNKKNAAAVGIVGKIRSAVEAFFIDADAGDFFNFASDSFGVATGIYAGMDYSRYWSLEAYKSSVKKDEKSEAWDELEKSVIASVADDVIVGVKGKQADIVVIKNFA